MTCEQILGAVICGGRHAGKKTLAPGEKRALVRQLKAMDRRSPHDEYCEETKPDGELPMAPSTMTMN